jgi:hypothetical protein
MRQTALEGVSPWCRPTPDLVVLALRPKGLAILSNHRDYSQIMKRVNSNYQGSLAPTSFLISTSS